MGVIVRLLVALVRWAPLIGRFLLKLGPWLVLSIKQLWASLAKGFQFIVSAVLGWFGASYARRAAGAIAFLVAWNLAIAAIARVIPSLAFDLLPTRAQDLISNSQVGWVAVNVMHLDLAIRNAISAVALWISLWSLYKQILMAKWLLTLAGMK